MANSSKLNEIKGLGNGINLVFKSFVRVKKNDLERFLANNDIDYYRLGIENFLVNTCTKSKTAPELIGRKANAFFKQANILLRSDVVKMPSFFGSKRSLHHLTSSRSFILNDNSNSSFYSTEQNPLDLKNLNKRKQTQTQQKLHEMAKERKVPSTRISRLINFGNLAAGLSAGAVSELTKRALGMNEKNNVTSDSLFDATKSVFLTEENVERIVDTLCKVRGAALKLGQMLSMQDETLISPGLQKIFDRVRQSADFMPFWQTEQVLKADYGENYMEKFETFDKNPFAAASIGQVHLAQLKNSNQKVAVKIQYPGVADSIVSDIDNLMSILNVAQLLPKGMFAESAIDVLKKELLDECDYIREANSYKKFSELLKDDPVFSIPKVNFDLTTKQILVTELINGEPFDKCVDLSQEQRNYIGFHMLRLCLNELFVFNIMQTDPNWSNFFYDQTTNKINLIDFGATRFYSKEFVDKYIKIIRAAADSDREGILKWSRELKFLTGYETKQMEIAHSDAVLILGEAFNKNEDFDFGKQQTTKRINSLVPVMLKYRLTPPPEETYTLHRKMSGAFLLCAKLKAKINCKPLFDQIYKDYKFSE